MRRTAFGRHEWFVKRRACVDFEASIAVRALTSTIMIRRWFFTRRRASFTVSGSPRISPILRRAGIDSPAKAPRPSIALGPTARAYLSPSERTLPSGGAGVRLALGAWLSLIIEGGLGAISS